MFSRPCMVGDYWRTDFPATRRKGYRDIDVASDIDVADIIVGRYTPLPFLPTRKSSHYQFSEPATLPERYFSNPRQQQRIINNGIARERHQ
jgi:hypothetical protein